MLLNAYTLHRLVDHWRPTLVGAKILDAFSQARDVLHIGFVTRDRTSHHLEISLDHRLAYILLRSDQSRKTRNSADVLPDLAGRRITDCRIEPADRRIDFQLDSSDLLTLRLYGSMNIFLLSGNGRIRDAFKDAKELTNRELESDLREDAWRDASAFARMFPTRTAFEGALQSGLAGLNRTLGTELSWRTRDTPYDAQTAHRGFLSFIDELLTSPFRTYDRFGEPFVLSPVELTHLGVKHDGIVGMIHDDPNEAVGGYVAARHAFDVRDGRRQAVARTCRNRLRKDRGLLKKLHRELDQSLNYDREEQKANLLTMNFAAVKRGMSEIEVTDIFNDGQPMRLMLDPVLSPQENAARFYTRARKMKSAVDNLQKRIQQISSDIDRLTKIESAMNDERGIDWKDVDRRHEEFQKLGWLQTELTEVRPPDRPPYREFRVSGNWRVFVGQNDKKNDELTFQFAHKNDLWFHARGVPGSHVLLKRDGRKDNPSKRAIEETAAIAAFYSKSKTSSVVPVIMTEKKYVRKRKGLRPGQVIVEREEVVMIEPVEPGAFAVDTRPAGLSATP